MRAIVLSCFLSIALWACNKSEPAVEAPVAETTAVAAATPESYTLSTVAGSETQWAELKDAAGNIIEKGFMLNGKRNGTWTYYDTKSSFPVKLISFVNDIHNGIYLEFNERGQAILMANYTNNKLDGEWVKYRFGRPEIKTSYKDGVLDGLYSEYNFKNGNLKKEVSYVNGLVDGYVRDYDEEGNVIVEYVFNKGEKVSGGIVKQ